MRHKFLLGATVNNELVFGEFEIREWNGYPEFSASFSTVIPFNAEYLYDLCERFDCRPSELPKNLADECYDVRDALDCSLYPEEVIVDGESWFFESSSCGQHDTRKDGMEEYTNEEAYNLLHTLWDNYHLKKVDEEVIEQIESLVDMLSIVDEEEWIVNYIKEHCC